ncbi:uncharacterized protein LOC108885459 [Lates calcarifer]|uniref:Uncharacterized protein LOC108885459 n=1 Tax=Lates calcarifer TaxID=8187 RepID=A0AAJ7V404_LATCA|nr:uncharacterized protein LOC108885459 [Lates calcarifer]XP_050926726.1 uncharacterized protein LOC108885459 [Lates calcarifer]
MNISLPTNQSTASNSTNGGEQGMSTSTVLYATVGGVAMLAVLVLALRIRKCREISKAAAQPQACSNSPDLRDEREFDSDYDNIGEVAQSMRKLSEGIFHPKQHPPSSASAGAECSDPIHIYENICCSRGTAAPRYATVHVQNRHDINSGIYINPLPSIISERTGDGCLREHTNKPTESCASNMSSSHSSSCTESRPRSLWFGLDLSGTI